MTIETLKPLLSLLSLPAMIQAGGPFLLERDKRRHERRMMAAALAGAVTGVIDRTQRARYAEFFRDSRDRLAGGEPVDFRSAFVLCPARDPVWEAHLGRLGYLPVEVCEPIVRFFESLGTIRLHIAKFHAGEFDPQPAVAMRLLDQGLALWSDMEADAALLTTELRRLAR